MKGLVLEGGGTKGAYQIGAYKALRELGIEFQGVTGTSIGALNGAYIIQNDIEVMEDIWLNYDYTHFMNIDKESYERFKNVDFTTKNINAVFELINKARKNEGIDISPLRHLMETTLNEDIIRKSKKDFGLVTVWWDKKINPHPLYIEDMPQGRLVDYLIASSSLPIFQTNVMDDKLYLDGMFCDNMPIGLLEDKGYEDVVVIRLIDDFLGKMNLNKHQNINIKTIIPSEYLGGSLNKDRDNVEKNIRLGYLDTMKAYERCDGIKYYFDVEYKYDEEYCFDRFRRMSNETIQCICNLLNIKRDVSLRTVMENVIPKLGETLGLPKNFSYKDLFYCVYEKKLEENSINRVKLYDFNKVIDVVNTNIDSNKNLASNFEIRPKISIKKNKNTKLLTNCIIKDLKSQS
ncbi:MULTISPECIES: patatin-like phospholipase family protein [unclassified Clostridioides]|uniref:patatin-like phospholipase family protein n=1 Tax=unclassified Clostridioides TaxID=2635829 RepID=UPI001D0C2246|nr:patatin-like phospholipase family protein [Clostridioides sp. ES-S-0001-02]MCC0651511.1 patatin-like phospholipase family protein [Clostridioides sp. ES-S-0001-03]MCC0674034.1 patatin-like phospholipase family protein [Clostridioides sp. ES-S-0145-01]MCC0680495.1 patatin-like phospholipase family protein [Clostridioides sp. ES-S-0005-03]MCC0694910.1 patatin-like phospholipase family protein [Clostridioides sp. ES-S-0048-02]MCC0706153.1 patatin-like phospholipase family protein [Clostridioid